METISESSDELCKDDSATDSLDKGVESIKTIESTFNDVKTHISKSIIDYSEIIDKYGKLAFKLAFSVLMSINAIIVTFIIIKLIFSFLSCENECLNCFLKSLIHIFWNILGLVKFVVLLLSSIFTLIGTVGKDLTSVVNFLVSDANLNSEHIILLESAPSYLTKCINGDGNITGDLDLDISALKNIKKLEDAYVKLGTAKEQLDEIFKQKYAYNNYSNNYNNIIIYKIDNFSLISYSKIIKLSDVLKKIHEKNQLNGVFLVDQIFMIVIL